MKRLVAPLLLLLAACVDDPADLPADPRVRIVGDRTTYTVPVEIAATPRTRRRGLMGRAHLPPDRGMLFVYPEEDERTFWMKNCLVPIDAAFLASDGHILRIAEMVPEPGHPFPPGHPSGAPVRLVLEMPGGWFRDHGIGVGDRVEVPEEIGRPPPR